MREDSNQDTVSNLLDNHLLGYERLLSLFKSIQKQTPKGVGLNPDFSQRKRKKGSKTEKMYM
jgi:hypothetical protein